MVDRLVDLMVFSKVVVWDTRLVVGKVGWKVDLKDLSKVVSKDVAKVALMVENLVVEKAVVLGF